MGWLGKIIGGTIGFAMGGPIGAVAGAVFGHTFDSSGQRYSAEERVHLSYDEQTQLTFFVATFSMLAKLARVDGRITKKEIDSIENFMVYDLKLSQESRKIAINIFHTAVESPQTFNDFAFQFYNQFRLNPQILEFMIDIMLRVSVADGILSESEEKLIFSAVRIFNLREEEYKKLKLRYVKENKKYYSILGCNENDSNEHIKRQYRKLVSDYHPDKIASKGLPEEFNKFAHDKFREIHEAYEEIKKERGTK